MIRNHINTSVYTNNYEIEALLDAIQPELDLGNALALRIFRNVMPSTAELTGIVAWEQLLGIIPDSSTESVEFRRFRLMNRIASNIPFSERALQIIMDNILGKGNWSYTLDIYDYWLYVASMRPGRNWVKEMNYTFRRIIPANMRWSLYLFIFTWGGVYEDYDSWEEVHDKFATWEDVFYGIER